MQNSFTINLQGVVVIGRAKSSSLLAALCVESLSVMSDCSKRENMRNASICQSVTGLSPFDDGITARHCFANKGFSTSACQANHGKKKPPVFVGKTSVRFLCAPLLSFRAAVEGRLLCRCSRASNILTAPIPTTIWTNRGHSGSPQQSLAQRRGPLNSGPSRAEVTIDGCWLIQRLLFLRACSGKEHHLFLLFLQIQTGKMCTVFSGL